jgi:IS30 family transposase
MTLKIRTSAEIETIGKLRAERFSVRAIAERFGVHWSTIHAICKKNGFQPNKVLGSPVDDELKTS